MAEPATTASAWSKVAGALKDWPLWLMAAAATSTTVLLAVPAFRATIEPKSVPLVTFGAVALWILAFFRAIAPALAAVRAHRDHRAANVRFVLTPIPDQSAWGASRQQDGSVVTQLSLRFMAKNRTDEPLFLINAKLKRPRIRGEVITTMISVQAPNSPMHGTAAVSGHHVPPNATLPASITLLVRGAPDQSDGEMEVVVDVTDADAHRERMHVKCRFMGVPLTAHAPSP